jgi:hypothetical protein
MMVLVEDEKMRLRVVKGYMEGVNLWRKRTFKQALYYLKRNKHLCCHVLNPWNIFRFLLFSSENPLHKGRGKSIITRSNIYVR